MSGMYAIMTCGVGLGAVVGCADTHAHTHIRSEFGLLAINALNYKLLM